MDLLGKALNDYLDNSYSNITFQIGSNVFERSPQYYFKNKLADLTSGEKLVIELCKGSVLDIGCGTGSYHIFINSNVLGIDNSKKTVRAAKRIGTNCIKGDIFNISLDKKFDTILFLGSSIGLGGSIEKTKELIGLLPKMLKSNGQILAYQKEIKKDYETFKIELKYKSKKQSVNWTSLSSNYLRYLFNKSSLPADIVFNDGLHYVIKAEKSLKE